MKYKLNTTEKYKDPYNEFWKNSEKEGYFSKKHLQNKYLIQLTKQIKEILKKNKEIKKIVDVGCGAGEVLIYLSKKLENNIKLIGVDTSSNAIKIAKASLKKKKTNNVFFNKMEPDMEIV